MFSEVVAFPAARNVVAGGAQGLVDGEDDAQASVGDVVSAAVDPLAAHSGGEDALD